MLRGILPPIPNLEIGYVYDFGKTLKSSRLTLDYFLPVRVGTDGAAFGEVHGEFTNFLQTISTLLRRESATLTERTETTTGRKGFDERTDLSFGAGYRRKFGGDLLLGVNGFYDTTKLGRKWYGSGSVGFEAAALLPGADALDLRLNFYGNLFQGRNSIMNAFRNGPGNFDLEAGYSHELFEGGPDLRLKFTGYRFDVGTPVYGWNAGAEVFTRDGLFRIKADTGEDRINGTYYSIGGSVNVGLRPERLLYGESPFVMPEPVFRSPRNLLRYLLAGGPLAGAKRRFSQPVAVVVQRRVHPVPISPLATATAVFGSIPPNTMVYSALTPQVLFTAIGAAGTLVITCDNPPSGLSGWINLLDNTGASVAGSVRIRVGNTSVTVSPVPSNWRGVSMPGDRFVQCGAWLWASPWTPGTVTITWYP
jgi:hypothetical protein